MSYGVCALCLLEKPLLGSHIIPEFILDGAIEWIPTGELGRKQPHLIEIDFDTLEKVRTEQKGNTQKRLGFKERLLCSSCEAYLQTGEDYVRKTLYGTSREKFHTPSWRTRRRYHCSGWDGVEERWVDYCLFKQFQVGVLWRCCTAKGKAFAGCEVEPELREQMRQALLTDDLPERLVSCSMRKMPYDPKVWFGLIMVPLTLHNGVFNFYMGGYRWQYFVEERSQDPLLLTRDGHLIVEITNQ